MIRALRVALYAAAVAVLVASIVFVLARRDIRCGMDEFDCAERQGWMPVLGGAALAGMLAYVGRALGGRSDRADR